MAAPKLKIISKKDTHHKVANGSHAVSDTMNLEQDKKIIKVYIDKVKAKLQSDPESQKKAAFIIENLLRKSK